MRAIMTVLALSLGLLAGVATLSAVAEPVATVLRELAGMAEPRVRLAVQTPVLPR